MATSTSSITTQHNIRSTSLPTRSHPIIEKIEHELKKIRKSESSSTSTMQTISIGLTGLAELYKCVNEVLNLPLTQQTLSRPHYHNHVKNLLEGSSKLIECCTNSRQILVSLKVAIEDLRSNSLVSQKEGNYKSIISRYFSTRKETIKSAKMLALSLKQLDHNLLVSYKESRDGAGQLRELEVTNALRCVSIINVSILESLLLALSMPMLKSKSSSTSFLILKLVGKKKQPIEDYKNALLCNVDVILHSLMSSSSSEGVAEEEKILVAQQRLEALEVALRGYEKGLNSIFTQLTKIRTSLVNNISV